MYQLRYGREELTGGNAYLKVGFNYLYGKVVILTIAMAQAAFDY